MEQKGLLTQQQVDYCMECGVCTGSCPVSRVNPNFSPRRMVKQTIMDFEADLLKQHEIWQCLSCARCSTRCPVEIDFPEVVRALRGQARKQGNLPLESHHGVLQSIASLQSGPVKQQRTSWAQEAGSFRSSGDTFYFVGCLPYFNVVFHYLELAPVESAKSILKLLNRMGIEPVLSDDERCCGHDALWSGDEDTFRRLARWNLELITGSGAKTVIFGCPEGYTTFKLHYPKYFGALPFEVLHVSEYLARELPAAGLSFEPATNGVVSYQDPCRLGRWAGIYEAPRQLIELLPGVRLEEMPRNRENALCCGTSAWMECSACSKAMQLERLDEALQTGAKTLITACPKCQIHLSCAKSGTDLEIDVVDVYSLLAKSLK
jgi:heterodisulfide reductase subunit D